MTHPSAGELRAKLYQRCEVLDESFSEEGEMILNLTMSARDRGWLESALRFAGDWSE